MRKPILFLAFVGLWLGFGTGHAKAQIKHFEADFPFSFQAGDKVFSKGSYAFQEEANRNLTIRAVKGNESASIAVTPLPPKNPFDPPKTWLIFRRYGDKYFLAEIWRDHLGVQLPTSEAEKKRKDSGVQAVQVHVDVK